MQPLWKTEWSFLKKLQIEQWLHLSFLKLKRKKFGFVFKILPQYHYSLISFFNLLFSSMKKLQIPHVEKIKKYDAGTFLVVQWLRLHVPTQGTWVWFLIGDLRFYMMHGSKKMLQWYLTLFFKQWALSVHYPNY